MKVVFFGTPAFSAKALGFLIENGIDIVAVITKPDRPQGRSRAPVPTPVKTVALSQLPPLPIFQPERVSDQEFAPTLAAFNADLFVVVAYGEILRQHLLDMSRIACINMHTSLLPKYRGAAPIQQAIIHGETESGVSIIHMVKKMDAGDIIATSIVPIDENMTFGELEDELCKAGCQALLEVLKSYEKEIEPPGQSQDETLVTFANKIELEDCQINWNNKAKDIHNLVRGVNPEPGAWCFVNLKGELKRLKIKKTHVRKEFSGSPGTILEYGKAGFIVACGEESIEILELQLEGKKLVNSAEFTRGLLCDALKFQTDK